MCVQQIERDLFLYLFWKIKNQMKAEVLELVICCSFVHHVCVLYNSKFIWLLLWSGFPCKRDLSRTLWLSNGKQIHKIKTVVVFGNTTSSAQFSTWKYKTGIFRFPFSILFLLVYYPWLCTKYCNGCGLGHNWTVLSFHLSLSIPKPTIHSEF